MESCRAEGEIVVIGAGMAGLVAARELQRAGRRVRVLDKGRGVGGRLATRRIGDATFDHGVPHFTLGQSGFVDGIAPRYLDRSLVPWSDTPTAGNPETILWRGTPTMSAIAKQLALGVEVHLGTVVTALRRESDHVIVETRAGDTFRAEAVVLTPPVPQALALLDAGGYPLGSDLRTHLTGVAYDRCLTVLASLEGPSRIPPPGRLAPGEEPLDWILDNRLKGVSAGSAVTIHATPRFSEEHWEHDRDVVGRVLLKAAAPWLGSKVQGVQVHGWRYSQPRVLDPVGCRVVTSRPFLALAGDGFGMGGVEGAALSGASAAEALLQSTPDRRS